MSASPANHVCLSPQTHQLRTPASPRLNTPLLQVNPARKSLGYYLLRQRKMILSTAMPNAGVTRSTILSKGRNASRALFIWTAVPPFGHQSRGSRAALLDPTRVILAGKMTQSTVVFRCEGIDSADRKKVSAAPVPGRKPRRCDSTRNRFAQGFFVNRRELHSASIGEISFQSGTRKSAVNIC